MARGTSSNEFVFIKKVDIEDDNNLKVPHWGLQEKKGGEWKITETYNYISGQLIGIEKGSYEYKKGKKTFTQHQFIMLLKDGDEKMKVSINYSYMSRGILNSLASVENFGGKVVKLTLYTNKDEFGACYTTVDGERVEWNLNPKDLPGHDDAKWVASFDYFINKIVDVIPKEEVEVLDDIDDVIAEAEKEAEENLNIDDKGSGLPF